MHSRSASARNTVGLVVGMLIAMAGTGVSAANVGTGVLPLIKVGEFHMKQARMGAAAVAYDGSIYILGGTSFGALTTIEKFDTRTAEVTSLKTELVPRRFHAAFEHDGKFYIFGGQGHGVANEWYERSVEIYDPATGVISHGPPMEKPKSRMGGAMIGDKVYLIGGTKKVGSGIAQTNDVDVFDVAKNKWSRGVPMPTPRETQAVAVTGFIMAVGGCRRIDGVNAVEMFVPEAKAWKVLPSLKRKIWAHSAAFLGENVFLFGDWKERDTVLAYNLYTRKSEIFKIPGYKGARFSTAIVWNERIYVIGGNADLMEDTETDSIQVFALNPDYPSAAPK